MGFSPSLFRCYSFFVIPAKAGIQELSRGMDPRLREDDGRSVMLLFVRCCFFCLLAGIDLLSRKFLEDREGLPRFRPSGMVGMEGRIDHPAIASNNKAPR